MEDERHGHGSMPVKRIDAGDTVPSGTSSFPLSTVDSGGTSAETN